MQFTLLGQDRTEMIMDTLNSHVKERSFPLAISNNWTPAPSNCFCASNITSPSSGLTSRHPICFFSETHGVMYLSHSSFFEAIAAIAWNKRNKWPALKGWRRWRHRPQPSERHPRCPARWPQRLGAQQPLCRPKSLSDSWSPKCTMHTAL